MGSGERIFATLKSVFDTPKWEKLRIALWDVVSEELKETKGLSTTWKLMITMLKQLKAERTAVAGAAVALEPDDPAVASQRLRQSFSDGWTQLYPYLLHPRNRSCRHNRQSQTVTTRFYSPHRLRSLHWYWRE